MIGVAASIHQRLRVDAAGGGWNPSMLAGVAAWYDPSDLTTMFEDAAGTVPVTGPGQPVGLMLDKSKGLGPELADSGGDVSKWGGARGNETLQQSGNKVRAVALSAAAFGVRQQFNGLVVGATYTVQYTSIIGTPTSALFRASSTVGLTSLFAIAGGAVPQGRYAFVAIATTMYIGLIANASAPGDYVEIGEFSLRHTPGNHLSQAVAAARPVYGREPVTGRRNLLVYSEDLQNSAWPKGLSVASAPTRITFDGTTNGRVAQIMTAAVSTSYTFSGRVRRVSGVLAADNKVSASIYGAGAVATAAQTLGNALNGTDWVPFSVTCLSTSSGGAIAAQIRCDNAAVLEFAGLQVEVGAVKTAYQKVSSVYDVTEAGVASRHYLQFDGVDDFLTGGPVHGADRTVVGGFTRLGPSTSFYGAWSGTNRRSYLGTLTANGRFGLGIGDSNAANTLVDVAGDVTNKPIVGLMFHSSDGSFLARVNATMQNSGAYAGSPSPGYSAAMGGLGAPTINNFSPCRVGPVLDFNVGLSPAERAQCEAWVNSQWGAY